MHTKHQRQAIAVTAARIIADEGQRNYGMAKRKAAARLGLGASRNLPSNHEVEAQLRVHQSLFVNNHLMQIRALQETALAIMDYFSELRPRLAGPVLDGTADQRSAITLHVFSDDPDTAVRLLLDLKLPFTPAQRRLRWYHQAFRDVQVLTIDWQDQPCELCLFDSIDLRQSPPSPIDGLPQRRVSARELREMLA